MATTGIKWDEASRRRFEQRLARLQGQYPTATQRAAAQVATQVLNDCMTEPPTVPKDTGTLRASGTWEVFGGASWREVKLTVGFNTTYAARVHEMPESTQWTTSGSGPKFLEDKIFGHGEEYVRMWGHLVARELGMA